MRYLGSNASNVLGLRNLNTGNQLKAGDQTVLQYRLTDSNNDVLNLHGDKADVYLKKDHKTIHITSTVVNDDLEVHFQLENVLEPGAYVLEIVVDDEYFFPSDNSEQIIVFESYLSLINEEIGDIIDRGDTTLADVREYIMTFVQNAIENSTYIAGANVTIDENNVISAIDHELRTLVGTKQDNLVAGSNISISENGVISAVDNDTVYDDTELRQQLDDKLNELIAGENVLIEDNTISAVDTVYDDTAITQRLDTVSQHIDELIRGDITIQEFMDRLSVLEANMREITQRTTTLRDNVEAIGLVVEDIENLDLTEIRTALATMQEDMEELREGVNDTTLDNEVDGLQTTVADLSTKVDALINEEPVPVHPDLQVILDEIIADIRHLEDELADDTPVEFDDTELRARIEALEAEIAAITRDGIYDDTALQAQVDALAGELAVLDQYVSTELQSTVDQLNDSLASVSELENAILVTIPADIAELRTQVDALNTHVSDIATEYSIRALVNRMDELEGVAYYFDGASEDVKNWLFENNAKALRFSGEGVYDPENLWLKADEYWYNSSTFSGTSGDIFRNRILTVIHEPSNIGGSSLFNYSNPPESNFNLVRHIPGAVFKKDSIDLSNKILSFRFNPSFFSQNYSEGPFEFTDSGFHLVFEVVDYQDIDGEVFNYHVNISKEEIEQGNGQVHFIMPSDYSILYIFPAYIRQSDRLNSVRRLSELNAMGLWIVDDVGDPDNNGGDNTAPGEFGTLTVNPVILPLGQSVSNVELLSNYVSYEGDLETQPLFVSGGDIPETLDPGIHGIFAIIPIDNSEYTDIAFYIPVIVGEDGQAVEDIDNPGPFVTGLTQEHLVNNIPPFMTRPSA